MQNYEVSPAALRALNEMREDYWFEDGPAFLDDVLDVLQHFCELTPAERQVGQELEAMPPAACHPSGSSSFFLPTPRAR